MSLYPVPSLALKATENKIIGRKCFTLFRHHLHQCLPHGWILPSDLILPSGWIFQSGGSSRRVDSSNSNLDYFPSYAESQL